MFDRNKIKKIETIFNAKHHCIYGDWHTFIGKGLLQKQHIAYEVNFRNGEVNKYSFNDGSPILFTELLAPSIRQIVKKIIRIGSIYESY